MSAVRGRAFRGDPPARGDGDRAACSPNLMHKVTLQQAGVHQLRNRYTGRAGYRKSARRSRFADERK